MKIKSNYELSISEENKWLLDKVAMEIGWDGKIGTAEEYVKRYFNNFYNTIRDKVETSMIKYNGEAGKANTASVLELYDSTVIKTITISAE